MGQYYMLGNLDKKEYLHPHRFGDGLKLLEFGSSGSGTMNGLAILLAVGNGRGGGDLHTETENGIVGSWAGDRIVIMGDYADEPDDWKSVTKTKKEYMDAYKGMWREEDENGRALGKSEWVDISEAVLYEMAQDNYLRDSLLDAAAWHNWQPERWDFLFSRDEVEERRKEIETRREAEQKALRPDMMITLGGENGTKSS